LVEVSGTVKVGMYEQELNTRHRLAVEVAQHTEGCYLPKSARTGNQSERCRFRQIQRKEDAPYRGRSRYQFYWYREVSWRYL